MPFGEFTLDRSGRFPDIAVLTTFAVLQLKRVLSYRKLSGCSELGAYENVQRKRNRRGKSSPKHRNGKTSGGIGTGLGTEDRILL